MENTSEFSVYELEYYNIDSYKYENTIDVYKKMQLFSEDVEIDTSQLFQYPEGDAEGADLKKISEDQFYESSELIKKDENNIPIYVVVKLKKGYSFEQFINSVQVKKLLNKNIWIESNETISRVNQIMKVKHYLMNFTRGVCMSVCVIMLEFLVTIIYLMYIKKKIICLAVYGYKYKELIKLLKHNNNDIIFRGIIFVCSIGYVFFFLKKSNLIIACIFSIVLLAANVLIVFLKRIYMNAMVKRLSYK